jgi:hypothetical protein
MAPLPIAAHRRDDVGIRDRRQDVPAPVLRRLAIRPGLIENIDDPSDATLWAFRNVRSGVAATLASRVVLDEATVASLTSDDGSGAPTDQPTSEFIEALQSAQYIGGYSSAEVTTALERGVLLDEAFDVALEFYEVQDRDAAATVRFVEGLPVIGTAPTNRSRIAPLETPFPNITVGAWRIQFRPNHAPGKGHKMGGCAPDGSPHIHFDLCYNRTGTRWDILNTLHVGKYTQSGKKCVFISNDPEKSSTYFCKKICTPTFRDLQGMYEAALANAAAAARVTVSAALIAAIAFAAAAATFGAVFAL